jgi:hypothetical protein
VALESKVCEQLTMQTWQYTCDFLHHDPAQRHSDYIVGIPGMARKLLTFF